MKRFVELKERWLPMKRIESGSSLSTWRTCPKKYSFSYEEKLENPNYSHNLGYGNFVHAFRAILHAEKVSPEELSKAFGELEGMLLELRSLYPSSAEQIKADCDLAEEITKLWWAYWNGDQGALGERNMKWLGVESEWSFNLVGRETDFHVGKRDGYVRQTIWDKCFLYELKTATDRGADNYLHRLELDHQINSNLIALEREGLPFDGVIYDVIWKPALRLLTGRKTKPDETLEEFNQRVIAAVKSSPSDYFSRICVNRTNEALAEYELELIAQYNASAPDQLKYRNASACMNFNSLCQFFQLCMDPHADEMRSVFRQRTKRLPELKTGD